MRPSKPLLLILAAVLAAAVGFLPARAQCLELFRNFSYFFLLLLFLAWLLRLAGCLRGKMPRLVREHLPALVLALLLMVLIFLAAPPRFKVLTDETNLLGVSLSMHLDQTAAIPVGGFFYDSVVPDFSYQVDKRPVFFPFLLSAIHALTGYRAQNAFVLNFLAGWGVLVACYWVVARYLPQRFAIAALLLAAGTPAFVIYTTSGGFETLNLLFIIATFLALIACLEMQAAPQETELLMLTLLLLAQCRYESQLLLPVVGLAVLPWLRRHRFFQRASWLTCALPLFLVPVLWQRRGFQGALDFQITKIGQDTYQRADSAFSLRHLLQNIDDNIFVLLGVNPHFGFSPVLALFALAGMYLLARQVVLRRPGAAEVALIGAAAVSFLLLLGLLSAFFWGLFTLPMDNRLALAFLPFLVCAAAFGGFRLCRALNIEAALPVYLVVAAHLLLFWPYGIQQRLINGMALPYEYRQAVNELRQRYPRDGSTVILAEMPNLYIVQGFSAFRLSEAGARLGELAAAAPAARIVALQKLDLQTGALQKASVLPDGFNLKPVLTIPVSTEGGLRISECQLKSDSMRQRPSAD
jgi:hypothetical protein